MPARLAILPGTNDAVQTILKRVLKGIGHDQWPGTLNEVADIVSEAIKKVNEEKRQLESFIASVTEQLGEITQAITEDHEDSLSGHRETLSLQKLVQKKIGLTLSAGLTEPKDNDDIETIYKRADAALYRTKNSGRNCQIVA
jgi:GGDEF domain-containing protein